ncbi:NCS2 family permease [Nocardioides sp.]|uniref:NCS2 family permease n=1 Tax=Nocardioides sp. TaxID=35761 RepID=UPI003526DFB2
MSNQKRPSKNRPVQGVSGSPTGRPKATGPGGLDGFFKISERGSTFEREIRGGVVTFFTMAYIVALNPVILGYVQDADGKFLGGGDAPNIAAIAAGTALVAGVMTILMGVVANFPLALATGLGLNAFVAFGIASQMTWADAMGLVVLEGVIILVLVLTGFRKAVFQAVPSQLKVAISVGIGLFIALIGFVDAGFVRRTGAPPVPVQLGVGTGELAGWPVLVFAVGLMLVIALWVRRVRGAILISIVLTTILAIIVEAIVSAGPMVDGDSSTPSAGTSTCRSGRTSWRACPTSAPWASSASSGPSPASVWSRPCSGLHADAGRLLRHDGHDDRHRRRGGSARPDGMPPNTQRHPGRRLDRGAAGGAAGVSSNTSYIESASGSARALAPGLASVVTGVLFLLTMFLAPLVEIIPSEAAVPALVLVGFLMMQQVKGIDWDDVEIAIPAFLTIVLMPFTYSITVGIGAGFLAYVLIKLVRGKSAQIHGLMWLVAALFLVYFAIHPITAWIT